MLVPSGGSIAPTVSIPLLALSDAGPDALYGFCQCSKAVLFPMTSKTSPDVPFPFAYFLIQR